MIGKLEPVYGGEKVGGLGGVGWDGWGGSRGRWVGGVRGWRVVGRVRVVCLGVWAVVGLGVGREQGRGAL